MSRVLPSAAFGLLTLAIVAVAPLAGAHDGKLTFAPVLAKATPAVVSIEVELPERMNPWTRRSLTPTAAGSGVIIDAAKGHVVTNHHVVERASEVTVMLADGRKFVAERIGSDPTADIALIKIDAEDLAALPLGNSDGLEVGDFVVAIGNPFGFGQTATSGIVSALGRRGLGLRYEDFIQTDASINRGNSGGPLVDLDGRIVGINTMIHSPSEASAGIGFAVPANIVRDVVEQLEESGEVQRAELGIAIGDVTPELQERLGLESAKGAVVGAVMAGSSAANAGIEPEDVVVRLNGREIVDSRDLQDRVRAAAVGR